MGLVSTDWDELTWHAKKRVCRKADETVTMRAGFDVFDETDYDGDDGNNTVVRDSYRVNYHPVSVRVTNRPRSVKVRVTKDGKAWRHIPVRAVGATVKTDRHGVATIPKSRIPRGKKVAFKVGGHKTYAKKVAWVRH